jgi:ribosomal protein L30/L7E
VFGIQPDCAITRHKATVNALSKHKASLHVFRLKKARDFMQQEKMDSIKIGRLRRIPESALDRFLANLKDRNKPTR